MSRAGWLVSAGVILTLAAPDVAQERPNGPTVDEVLREVVRAYRAGPIAERVTVRVSAPAAGGYGPPVERTSGATVRVLYAGDPGARVMRLDLGVLSVYAHADELIVVRSDDPGVCLRRRLSGAISPRSIAPVLPPLAFPQIQLALGEDASPAANLTPFTRAVRWRVGDPGAGAPAEIRLTGSAPGGEARMTIDGTTHRLRELSMVSTLGAGLVIRCEPVDPGDPAQWTIDPGDRRVVRSLTALGVPESPIGAGEIVPQLPLHDQATDVWSLDAEFAARGAGNPLAARAPALLVMARVRPAGTDPAGIPGPARVGAEGARVFLRRARLLAAEHDNPEERTAVPFWYPVLVFEVEEFTRERLTNANARWREAFADGAPEDGEPAPLWSSAGRALLDRFARGADVIIAAVAPDGHLIGATAVTGTDTRDTVSARLSAIFEDDQRRFFVGPEPR